MSLCVALGTTLYVCEIHISNSHRKLTEKKIPNLGACDSNISNLSVSGHLVEEVTQFTYLHGLRSVHHR